MTVDQENEFYRAQVKLLTKRIERLEKRMEEIEKKLAEAALLAI